MKKVKFLQILLTLLTIVAFVLLTGEIFMGGPVRYAAVCTDLFHPEQKEE